MYKEEREYQAMYGDLPDDTESLLSLLEHQHNLDFHKIREEEERIKQIPWGEEIIYLPLIPTATPRPRWSSLTNRFYVKGAAKNKRMIKKYIDDLGLICTRVIFILEVYLPTPESMSLTEKYLAEKGLILPISKPDFDNLAKTYSDAITGILLYNDNIINPGLIKKYYSIKPRIKITLRYQQDFDSNFNKRRVLTTKTYQDLSGGTEWSAKTDGVQREWQPSLSDKPIW